MKLLLRLACVVFLVAVALSAQPRPGHIEIRCEPGVAVFLDGVFKGPTTTEFGFPGLLLMAVTPGAHTLRFAKEGFDPAEAKVVVTPGAGVKHTVEPFVRQVQVKQSGEGTGQ